MYCVKCNNVFPWKCTCKDKEQRLAALSGDIVFKMEDDQGDILYVTPSPVQPVKINKKRK